RRRLGGRGGRRGLAWNQVRLGDGRRLDRLRGRGQGGRRLEQHRVLAHQPPRAPVHLDQEGEQRLLQRRGAGDADHRLAAVVQRGGELQVGGGRVRRGQADAAEGVGRGQSHLQVAQLGRIGG